MEFKDVRAGDKVRLSRLVSGGDAPSVVGRVTRPRDTELSLDGMTYRFVADCWSLELLDRPWKPPSTPGLYQSRSELNDRGLSAHNIPIYRLSAQNSLWYKADIHGRGGWVIVGETDLPQDIVRLVPEEGCEGGC